uniref:Uncharacterized protein n=1 Tax=Arundo donax TaxID=35708 RepID=A0A0A9HLZ3_ARUDO
MKSIVISNNNFTIGYPRYELDSVMAVTANSEVFGDPNGLSWFRSEKPKCNSDLLAVMH